MIIFYTTIQLWIKDYGKDGILSLWQMAVCFMLKERGEGMGGGTKIASVIENNEIGKAYDDYCKKILCKKQILSYIIKECVSEFADIPLQEIPYYRKYLIILNQIRNMMSY